MHFFEMLDKLPFISERRGPTLRTMLVRMVLRSNDYDTVPAGFAPDQTAQQVDIPPQLTILIYVLVNSLLKF